MVVCIDTGGIIYTIINTMGLNITGSIFLSTLFIVIILIGLLAAMKVPVEISMLLLLPLLLSFLACIGNDWLAITGTILIYLGIILAKNFFFRS